MSKLVTIIGGSGFVGRYIARRLAKEGWRVRVAVEHKMASTVPNSSRSQSPVRAASRRPRSASGRS